jgi:hypothetical protein
MSFIGQNFHLPLSIEAHDELIQLHNCLHVFQLNSEVQDFWVFKLGKGVFRPSIVYQQHFQEYCYTSTILCNLKKQMYFQT